jgi:acyl carrier protein
LYDEARIEQMLRQYVRILDAMRSDPAREIGALDIGPEDAFVRPDSASTAPTVRARAGGTRRLPRTSTEAAVWRLFVEALGHEIGETMSAEDSFFELGGHSLMAADLVARIAQDLNVDVPLRLLFEAPSVAGLSARLSAGRPNPAGADARPVSEER